MAFASKTFVERELDREAILGDVKTLTALTPKQREALCTYLGDGYNIHLKRAVLGESLQHFLGEHDLTVEAFECARRLAMFLVASHRHGDTPEVVLGDLAAAGELRRDAAPEEFSVHRVLTDLLPSIRRIIEDEIREDSISSGSPCLSGISYACDARPVMGARFKPLRDSAASYSPTIASWVPVCLVRLRTSDDEPFQFQLDRDNLERVLETLQAAKKEMDLIDRQVCAVGRSSRDGQG